MKINLHKIAMLGNHLPRQCGIATFTTDLSEAISGAFPALECFVIAMNDAARRHVYPRGCGSRSPRPTWPRTGAPRTF